MNEKQGKLICFNVALTLSGKVAEQFTQLWCSHKLSSASNDVKVRSSKSLS